uniref:hypothetical protein n=1 Tax=Cronobacter dublinensis TaxID=413497 RepID=UPI001F282EB4
GSKSRNKVSVGEPAEGSLTRCKRFNNQLSTPRTLLKFYTDLWFEPRKDPALACFVMGELSGLTKRTWFWIYYGPSSYFVFKPLESYQSETFFQFPLLGEKKKKKRN